MKPSAGASRAATRLPRARMISHNIHSLSANAVSTEGCQRHTRVIRHIAKLMQGREVVLLQETWLGKYDTQALRTSFPQWDIRYNNDYIGHGGLITMVRRSYGKNYIITRVQMAPAAEGRVLALNFKPRAAINDTRTHFNIVNVYFSSGQADMASKGEQICSLSNIDNNIHTYMGGDFNFVESDTDCSGPLSGCCLSGPALEAWGSKRKGFA